MIIDNINENKIIKKDENKSKDENNNKNESDLGYIKEYSKRAI